MEPNSHIEEQQSPVSELATPISEDGSAELSKSTNGNAQNGSPEGESETRSSRGGKRRRRGGGELANLIGATVAGASEETLLYNQFLMDRPKRSTRLGDNRVLTYNESALFQQFATSSYSTPSSRTSSGGGASRATTGVPSPLCSRSCHCFPFLTSHFCNNIKAGVRRLHRGRPTKRKGEDLCHPLPQTMSLM